MQEILKAKSCLDCHSAQNKGAAGGGLGGKLEDAAKLSEEVLTEWLKNPSTDNAAKLKIRETPVGAMQAFALTEDQAKLVADWIKNLEKK